MQRQKDSSVGVKCTKFFMSELGREQPKRLEHNEVPESVDLEVSEEGDVSVTAEPAEGAPIKKRGTDRFMDLPAGRLPNPEDIFSEKKPGLKAEEYKSLVDQIDGLGSAEGKLTIEDIKRLMPPETVALLSRWQLHSARSHVRKALRRRYMNRIETAMAKRGDISELSEEERTAREERYSADVGKVDEEYGYADLLSKVTRYIEKDSGEKF